MVDYIKYTPEMANNWSRAYIETHRERPWAFQRLVDASTTSQLESKFWLTEELSNVNESPKSAVLLGGWFAHVITSLLLDYTSVEKVTNFEIDEDAHFISYKFNRRYKKKEEYGDAQYRSIRRNVLFESLKGVETFTGDGKDPDQFDLVINTSCEHMFPMWKFRELNPQLLGKLFVLQSTNAREFEDHINCVDSEDELVDQSMLGDILYKGSKVLDNGLTRFMVIGK
tara:strand:- start:119 stop:799 length:681 start_codon:yes stop_codon:yes gene_type:complete